MTPLGQKVKELRVAKDMTQQRLAEEAGVMRSLVVGLETGRRSYVSVKDVEGLASALGVPSDEMWETVPGGRSRQKYIPIKEAA